MGRSACDAGADPLRPHARVGDDRATSRACASRRSARERPCPHLRTVRSPTGRGRRPTSRGTSVDFGCPSCGTSRGRCAPPRPPAGGWSPGDGGAANGSRPTRWEWCAAALQPRGRDAQEVNVVTEGTALRPAEHGPRPGGQRARRDDLQRRLLGAGRRDARMGRLLRAVARSPAPISSTATIISFVINIPVLIMMALLASSMPRTGGDYVWVSRILSPPLALDLATSARPSRRRSAPRSGPATSRSSRSARSSSRWASRSTTTTLIDVGHQLPDGHRTGSSPAAMVMVVLMGAILIAGLRTTFRWQNTFWIIAIGRDVPRVHRPA